jgi:hypothetical protein
MSVFKKSGKEEMLLEDVSNLLNEIRLPTSLVFTPTNLDEEKKKFFASDDYNPNFTYRIVDNKNAKIFSELASLKGIVDVDPRISDFYMELIEAKKEMDQLMNLVGNNYQFTKIAKRRFKRPTPILFRNACRVLRGRVGNYELKKEVTKDRTLHFEEIKDLFEKALKAYGLDDWTVNESINIHKNGIKVGVKRREILMDRNITKKASSISKSIVHEMVHIMRSYNGALTGYEALSKPNIASYLDVEEGLAVYTEEMMGVMKYRDLKKSAARVWAIYIGEELSFRELYDAALAFTPRNTAFDLVYRIKRGLGDTSMPGVYGKDIAYFRGFRRVRKKCESDKTLYNKLFAGKIDFAQVKWVDEGLIPKPEIVPSEKKYKEIFAGL